MIRTRTPRWWLAVALTSFACTWTSAWAQAPAPSATPAWPTKPIRLIVPLTPGSATDVMARVVMDQVWRSSGSP